ncbi:hypothetical protein NXG04_07560 [Klebsiella pneumoniae]|nr:hypothetical protein [Klebsiella pneumoniae]MDS7714410.1 hypothetical protein [Klebsiella pneumoniae]
MQGLKLLEHVFAEEIEKYGDVDLYGVEEIEGVTEYEEELNYNSGWYNYSDVTFKYKGKMYTFEFKEHTSDNVCDKEIFLGTFREIVEDKILSPIELFGGVENDLTLNKETFTKEEVIRILHLSPIEIVRLINEADNIDI